MPDPAVRENVRNALEAVNASAVREGGSGGILSRIFGSSANKPTVASLGQGAVMHAGVAMIAAPNKIDRIEAEASAGTAAPPKPASP